MAELRRADTALAEWLAHAMARWINPRTQMPGISQRRLAEETGISQTQMHMILKRGHSPGPDILLKFADFFEANPLTVFALAYLDDGQEATYQVKRSGHVLAEQGFPWSVVDKQEEAVALFKHEPHADTFRILVEAENWQIVESTDPDSEP